ncbi:DUF2723 domain-containing protein [Flavobacteriaceae bacterium]|jgi:hypothetical protein|nr:DUF2723 domain-containing protein [Flavobacteriaceae bacterium]MDA9246594.1 DUF2723 domain-containing protein [bacterium]MDA9226081.1 DUF2723 domain-containing protein [Flavobacteriaceae bacterium]MDA9326381.1 DUF2723 domain-containing protein [Flavobacteriaceae bacterium]MDA9937090.1 DUF2723 domain-containing protein [Flavobacteriaceae bacterium]
MTEKTYRIWNLGLGWTLFAIALFTFGSTVEPTASFWDAGEYIATSAKLQVGHPPGAPFFQMMGAFFALFATGPQNIAVMVNFMSVFSSAFTILFLFWTLTLLLKKLPSFRSLDTISERIGFFGSAAVGALAFCFSDSFWFNAVETEVYAMATLILSSLFWMGLRWEQEMNTPRGDRWLLMIAFVIGLSFGVHFMGLLTIPAIGMIYYFKNFKKITVKGFIYANLIATAILLFIFKLLLPLTLAFFGNAEVFFVNSIGLPFNSGTLIAAILFIAFFYYSLKITSKKQWVNLNTGVLGILFVLIGFSCWIMIPIRANANTVINENSPSDARLLLAYYNLEQYPETKLFYGPMFSDIYAGQDPVEPFIDDKPKYERDYKTGRYKIVNFWKDARFNSNSAHSGFLPRLWSSDHAGNYMNFTEPLEFSVKSSYRSNPQLQQRINDFREEIADGSVSGEQYHDFLKQYSPYLTIEKPSFISNLKFFFEYQLGYMYWRYFMWNFTGRQNDKQGEYNVLNGNWLSGIPFVDEIRLGNQSELHQDALNNKARNTYFFLPFILGLVGLYFLYQQDPKRFWVLMLFFLFTGIALKVYLNERPFEPRERDYALVGSFYVYSIWIGLGCMGLINWVQKFIKFKSLQPVLVTLCLLGVPLLMGYQNWDDHDRSDRFTAQSMARSYLQSIQKNKGAMIFTIGDNDTFALWYAQDIEGYRTDVRTINSSLLGTDWYIDQMKRKTYESEPIPSQMTHDLYAYGVRDVIRYQPVLDSVRWDIKDFMNWVASDHPRTKIKDLMQKSGNDVNQLPESQQEGVFYPTRKIRIPVNKENVLKSGIVNPEDADKIVPYIDIDLPESAILKNQMMMLDIVANNDWERPIYFTGGSYSDSEYLWMKKYLQLEGLVYKLVPIKTDLGKDNPYLMGRIDADLMYDIVTQWNWGNSESPEIYHDPETRKNSISFRSNMARLSEQLINEGKKNKAKTIIDLALEKMPLDYFGFYSLMVPFVDGYYSIDEIEKAQELSRNIGFKYYDRLNYFSSLDADLQYSLGEEIITEIERYRTLVEADLKHAEKADLLPTLNQFIAATDSFKYLYGDYEYYTSLIDVAEGYFIISEMKLAESLSKKITGEFKKRLQLYSQFSQDNQLLLEDRIKNEFLNYNYLLQQIKKYGSEAFFKNEEAEYNETIELFTASLNNEEAN